MALVWLLVGFGAAAQSAPDGWFEDDGNAALEAQAPSQAEEAAPAYELEEALPAVGEEPGTAEDDEALDEQTKNQRAVEEFSPHLAPYGVWVDDSTYGRVWVPNARVVGAGFAPYVSGGHWELTVNDDWLWVSDYPFGWVAFHYGRWVYLPGSHWAWVPGYRWAPAWVDFRVGSSVAYVGWGPSRPSYVWRNGVFVSFSAVAPVPFVFCSSGAVFSPSLHRHVVRDRYRVRQIALETSRYRTRRVYGGAIVRAPSVREARIPAGSVPRQRVMGRPRSVEQRYSVERVAWRRDGGPQRSTQQRSSQQRSSGAQLSSPSSGRYRSSGAGAYRGSDLGAYRAGREQARPRLDSQSSNGSADPGPSFYRRGSAASPSSGGSNAAPSTRDRRRTYDAPTTGAPYASPRRYDSRGQDSRGYDSRGQDSRGQDSRGQDSRSYDSRGYDSRGQDSRSYDSRGHDSRGHDSRGYTPQGTWQRSDAGTRGTPNREYNAPGRGDSGRGSSGGSSRVRQAPRRAPYTRH